ADRVHDASLELTLPEGFSEPKELAPSPDGMRIAFRVASGGGDVFVAPIAGGAATKITDFGDHTAAWPAWSPDGKWIVVQDKEKSWQAGLLAIVPVSGGTATPILDEK